MSNFFGKNRYSLLDFFTYALLFFILTPVWEWIGLSRASTNSLEMASSLFAMGFGLSIHCWVNKYLRDTNGPKNN
jgi:hypothetical protein